MAKSIVDYILDEDYKRYNELLDIAEAAKAAAPKAPRKTGPRGPLSLDKKQELAEKRVAAARAKLEAMLAAQTCTSSDADAD